MTFGDAKEQVRQATDIVDLVGAAIPLRRAGATFKGLCPWHNDRAPSLMVDPRRQTWRCYVCDIGGDAFSFVMQREGCDFREALQMLADRAGIELSKAPRPKAEPGSPDDKNTLYQCCEWATRQFHECLLRGDAAEAARQYVEERGITPASVELFSIGFSPDHWTWLQDRARNTPYSPKVLEATGLVGTSERGSVYDRFKGRLIFPIRDTQGRTIAFGGRVLPGNTDAKAGKYVNCPGTRLYSKTETLYALDIARNHVAQSRELTIVEGYTDVILCHQHGVNNVIACCGTAVTESHIRVLKRFADAIYLVLDGDEAGQNRTNDILELFVAAQVDLRILSLPDELDPAEFMIERGGEAFTSLMSTAIDALEHKIRVATRGIDLVRDTHRANQALEEILATIARGMPPGTMDTSSLRAHQLLARLARDFQIGDADLRTRFAELRRGVKSRASVPGETREVAPAEQRYRLASLSAMEIELLELLDLHPELAPTALAEVADDDLADVAAKLIFATYRRLEEAGESLEFGAVLAEIENPSLKNLLVTLDERAHAKLEKALLDGPTRLRSVIRQIRQTHEERERRETEAALEQRVYNDTEELDVLSQMIAAKRRQQGLIVPTDG
ncbi:MAG: DNA primase [Pirellulaceae bacterium]|nr:DNA primase [Pirellulaceae bacterium]